jgi:hypothetical protein
MARRKGVQRRRSDDEALLSDRYTRWLMLADIALANASREQRRIKTKLKPDVEPYRRTACKHAA